MVTKIFSSLPGKEDFTKIRNDVNSNSRSVSPTNNACSSRQQPEKIQNYSPFRCATDQRRNNFFDRPFLFIKKQTNILPTHPDRFYSQKKTKMTNQSNIQEYCRYRNAQFHTPKTVNDNYKEEYICNFRLLLFRINIYLFLVIQK